MYSAWFPIIIARLHRIGQWYWCWSYCKVTVGFIVLIWIPCICMYVPSAMEAGPYAHPPLLWSHRRDLLVSYVCTYIHTYVPAYCGTNYYIVQWSHSSLVHASVQPCILSGMCTMQCGWLPLCLREDYNAWEKSLIWRWRTLTIQAGISLRYYLKRAGGFLLEESQWVFCALLA